MSEKNPCIICESYTTEEECDNETCPLFFYKKEYERMKSENEALRKKIDDFEYRKGWEDEIRTSDWRRTF